MASPMGKAMFAIIGAMAELEPSLISERVTAGMQAARSRGKHMGRPPLAQHIIAVRSKHSHEKIAGKPAAALLVRSASAYDHAGQRLGEEAAVNGDGLHANSPMPFQAHSMIFVKEGFARRRSAQVARASPLSMIATPRARISAMAALTPVGSMPRLASLMKRT